MIRKAKKGFDMKGFVKQIANAFFAEVNVYLLKGTTLF